VATSQWGCTDPLALNFNPLAQLNDGTCTYPPSNYQPVLTNNLNENLNENSALIHWNNELITLNDGGNEAALFFMDLAGNIVRKVVIEQATNYDWEALAQDSQFIYIGDFGNNYGNRTNLCVYKVSKTAITNSTNDTVQALQLNFTFENQTNFSAALNANNFDCEGFFYHQDYLHLFTKNWLNLQTRHYILPNNWVGTVNAIQKDSFLVDGLITDATIDSATARILLIGYKNNGNNLYTSFIWILSDFSPHHYFSGNKRRIEIGNMLSLSQTEGITLIDSVSGYLSSERISSVITIPAKLFTFNLGDFFYQNDASTQLLIPSKQIELYPNPANGMLYFSQPVYALSIKALDGTVVVNAPHFSDCLDINSLKPGLYYVKGTGFCEKLQIY